MDLVRPRRAVDRRARQPDHPVGVGVAGSYSLEEQQDLVPGDHRPRVVVADRAPRCVIVGYRALLHERAGRGAVCIRRRDGQHDLPRQVGAVHAVLERPGRIGRPAPGVEQQHAVAGHGHARAAGPHAVRVRGGRIAGPGPRVPPPRRGRRSARSRRSCSSAARPPRNSAGPGTVPVRSGRTSRRRCARGRRGRGTATPCGCRAAPCSTRAGRAPERRRTSCSCVELPAIRTWQRSSPGCSSCAPWRRRRTASRGTHTRGSSP